MKKFSSPGRLPIGCAASAEGRLESWNSGSVLPRKRISSDFRMTTEENPEFSSLQGLYILNPIRKALGCFTNIFSMTYSSTS